MRHTLMLIVLFSKTSSQIYIRNIFEESDSQTVSGSNCLLFTELRWWR